MSYFQPTLDELFHDDQTIDRVIEEEKNERKTHNIYDLLNTTDTTRKVFYKINSGLHGTSYLSDKDNNLSRNHMGLEKCIQRVAKTWLEDEYNSGSSLTEIQDIMPQGLSIRGHSSSVSSTRGPQKIEANGFFTWSSHNDITDGLVESEVTRSDLPLQEQNEKADTDDTQRKEEYTSNDKLFQEAHECMIAISASEIKKTHDSIFTKYSNPSAEELNADTQSDLILTNGTDSAQKKEFKMDPLLEFRPVALKKDPGVSPNTARKNKRKSKGLLGNWMWGLSTGPYMRGEHTEKKEQSATSIKSSVSNQLSSGKKPIHKDDFNLIDMSDLSYALADPKSVKNSTEPSAEPMAVPMVASNLNSAVYDVQEEPPSQVTKTTEPEAGDETDFDDFQTVEFTKARQDVDVPNEHHGHISMEPLEPKRGS